MKRTQKKSFLIGSIAVVALVAAVVALSKSATDGQIQITVPVQKGNFQALVYSTGQLQAERSVSIDVPSELSGRRIGIYEIKITKLVEEGTVVDSGEFVAALDHSAVEELLNQGRDNLEKALRSFEDAKIDTNINLSNLRDELLNSKVAVEEKKLILNQSVYESPAVKRQASLDLERAERQLDQDKRNYELKQKQDVFKVQRAIEEVNRQRETVNEIERLFEAMNVKAPQPGMVIYGNDRFGNKIKVGSTVNRWAPQIAMLPDMTSMISKTFINEIDISRVKTGQKVKVGIDAFPDKEFDGIVTIVANIGQVLPGGDAKVFEVTIRILGSDPLLRPAMTTSNAITTDVFSNVLFVPLDAVFKNDSLQYVYKRKDGPWEKQVIEIGVTNENFAVAMQGVDEGYQLLLNEPENGAEMPYKGLDIYEQIKQKKAESEQRKAQQLKDSLEQKTAQKPQDPAGNGERRGGNRPNRESRH
ncbi:MAG: RND transporter [Breznakibacter sp.]